MMRPVVAALATAWLCCALASNAADPLSEGIAARLSGDVLRAIDVLQAARGSAESPHAHAKATAELGVAYLQAGRLDDAQAMLSEATESLSGSARARYTLDLARVAVQRDRREEAARLFREAAALAPGNARITLVAELNLVQLAPLGERRERLARITPAIARVGDDRMRATLHLNAGWQAQTLGDDAVALAYAQLDAARRSADRAADGRLRAEALDGLAALYESRGRDADALALARQALTATYALDPAQVSDLAIDLEWRVGRLARALGDNDLALASYQRAVANIEAVRPDIPIQYEDGRSSYRATLEPVFLGYADLLFGTLGELSEAERRPRLERIRGVIELTRQAELQDYLRDRCDVEAIQSAPRSGVGQGVAVLYPIVFRDRIELLLETDAGIAWRTTRVEATILRITAEGFARDLRGGSEGFMTSARTLYRWLFAPFEQALRDQRIDTMIVVPEGSLRLVPMNALHDGERFAIERFAVGTVTGLTMTNTSPPAAGERQSLVAGMSVPGPVVDRLPQATVDAILGPPGPSGAVRSRSELRESLALPGVKEEVTSIARTIHGRTLLDEDFTARAFQREARSGDYRIVHIASHGVFGGSADTSYIMAYDDVLSMRDLQSLLRDERFRRRPIELLSLSACQSAEGNDRAPLGISGAAVKARAKSVLGTLWPVDDDAARTVMENFYSHLSHDRSNKVKALQRAQMEAMREPRFAHPFFWAPFVLIGNWL